MNPSKTDASEALWTNLIDPTLGASLAQDLSCDVCVVGAGIAGLTTAYLLQKEGKKVCVVEAFEVGSGQTGRTTAQFVTSLDDRYFEIEKYHGAQGAKLAGQSHRAAIDIANTIVRQEAIDCDCRFVDGYLFRAPESPESVLHDERDAAHRAGLTDVYLTHNTARDPFLRGEAEVLCFPQQLQLNPIKYLNGLAKAFLKSGGKIFTNTPVDKVSGGPSAVVVTKGGSRIQAAAIVVATNSPINDIFAIHTKQAPYRSYVIGVRVPDKSLPDALYWDTLDAYHYVRMAEGNIALIGGEDHKTGQEDDPKACYERLENWFRKKFPAAQEVVYRWSGQVMEPVDGMAFIGHNPLDRSNVYIITGDSGNGMTHATLGAKLVTDQIHGRKNDWEDLYSPARKSIRATYEFLKENGNVALQYLDWLTPKSSGPLENLVAGEGMLIREGVHIAAVYKDEEGRVTKCSAVCPHLGGIVHWNTAEKSWDCPCHGSRFDAHGKVIEGPTMQDLASLTP